MKLEDFSYRVDITITVIVVIFLCVLHYSIYTWIEKLEKANCDCSSMWERDVVKNLTIIFGSILIIRICLMLYYGVGNAGLTRILMNTLDKSFIYYLYMPFMFIISVLYLAFLFSYIYKLKSKECECSEDWKRELGWYYAIIQIVYISIVILIAAILLASTTLFVSSK